MIFSSTGHQFVFGRGTSLGTAFCGYRVFRFLQTTHVYVWYLILVFGTARCCLFLRLFIFVVTRPHYIVLLHTLITNMVLTILLRWFTSTRPLSLSLSFLHSLNACKRARNSSKRARRARDNYFWSYRMIGCAIQVTLGLNSRPGHGPVLLLPLVGLLGLHRPHNVILFLCRVGN